MAGFRSEVVYANNGDFSIANSQGGFASNGLQTNGQMWIGTTTPNVGGTQISVGSVISPLGTLSVGYTFPNITIDLVGGAVAVEHLTGDTGGQLNPTSNNFNILGGVSSAGTNPVLVNGSGSTLTVDVQISQAIASTDATKIGLCNFDSSQFTVDSNGFVAIASSFPSFTWSDSSGTVTAVANNGYFITGTCTSTLPASPSEGNRVRYIVDTTSILTIQAAGTQLIRFANTVSAAGGTAVNTLRGDSMELIYRATGTTWISASGNGEWNIT